MPYGIELPTDDGIERTKVSVFDIQVVKVHLA